MKTSTLIEQLAQDVTPVRPIMAPGRLALGFSILSLTIIALGLLVVSMRADAAAKMANLFYLSDFLLPFLQMIVVTVAVGQLSIPGHPHGTFFSKGPVLLGILLMAYELTRVWPLGASEALTGLDIAGLKCCALVLVFALLPVLILVALTARRAPVRPVLVGILIAVGGVSAGEMAITLHCPIDNAVHIALWHFAAPLAAGASIGALALAKFLRW